MPKYFIGNVLSPTETQPETHDPTFAFTKKEALDLDLTDIPIRMEHHPDLEVGMITRHWTGDDGSVWVVGKLNDNTLESRFANYAIDKNPETGESYYTGLSLQHTHTQYANSSNSKKEAVEVSLCVNPRRSDCRICFVDKNNIPNEDETKKVVYKIHKASLKSNMSQPETVVQPTQENVIEEKNEEVSPSTETPVESEQKPSLSTEMSKEDMMRVIIQQQKDLEETSSVNNKDAQELKELKAMLEQQKESELQKDTEKAYALSKALVDQWAETLDKTELDEASKQAIQKMARDYPRESMAMLKVAHCASTKYKNTNKQFNEYKEMMQRTQLQEKFEAVMQKKRPAQQIVHAASVKKQRTAPVVKKQSDVSRFLSAINKYNVSGSARDHMDAVSQIGQRRQVNSRAPYY